MSSLGSPVASERFLSPLCAVSHVPATSDRATMAATDVLGLIALAVASEMVGDRIGMPNFLVFHHRGTGDRPGGPGVDKPRCVRREPERARRTERRSHHLLFRHRPHLGGVRRGTPGAAVPGDGQRGRDVPQHGGGHVPRDRDSAEPSAADRCVTGRDGDHRHRTAPRVHASRGVVGRNARNRDNVHRGGGRGPRRGGVQRDHDRRTGHHRVRVGPHRRGRRRRGCMVHVYEIETHPGERAETREPALPRDRRRHVRDRGERHI